MTSSRPGLIGRALRVAGAGAAVYLGGLFAVGSLLAARWAGPGSAAETTGYTLLALLLVAAATAAWWFLLPRARWWGLPITVLVAVVHGLAFTSGL
ncbi:hypothetical protein [Actinoplanes sp. NPDC051494]|uniref:hypothetical protein n=1 Tax=Actinoplanes sp. NPDC051494 TaxID=3363907 RepID=UPI00378C57E3